MEQITVGIDVSKDRLDVAMRPSGEAFGVARNATGLEQLVARLKAVGPHLVALEATGGFETVAAAALAAAGLPVVIVNPAQVRCFAKAIGQRAKTDPIDAAVIAHFVAATQPEPRPLPDEPDQAYASMGVHVFNTETLIDAVTTDSERADSAHDIGGSIVPEMVDREMQLDKSAVTETALASLTGDPAWQPTFAFRLGWPERSSPASPRRALADVTIREGCPA